MGIIEHNFAEWDEYQQFNHQSYRATLRHCGRGGVELSVRLVKPMFEPKIPGPSRDDMTEAERQERDRLNRLRSVARARRQLRLLVKSMGADRLLTLTWRENMTDIDRAQKAWQKFVRLVRVRYPDNKFLCVREYQERGAIHLHVALSGHFDVHWLRYCWYVALGHKAKFVYPNGKKTVQAFIKPEGEKVWRPAYSSEVLGSINIRGMQTRWGEGDRDYWKADKIAFYLTKYLDKSFDEIEDGRRRYWPSQNCEKPTIKKFWLGATNVVEAIKEAHALVSETYGMTRSKLWLSFDNCNIWIAGVGNEPPF